MLSTRLFVYFELNNGNKKQLLQVVTYQNIFFINDEVKICFERLLLGVFTLFFLSPWAIGLVENY